MEGFEGDTPGPVPETFGPDTSVPDVHGPATYGPDTYGEAFADVYDDWYADVTDVAATVRRVAALAGPGGRVLELGVGTGRLAVAMGRAGLAVVGVDASAAMLARLAANDPDRLVAVIRGDMVDDLPAGPFDVVLVAYNTLFNLLEGGRQRACFGAVAERLAPGGRFVVEAYVPDLDAPAGAHVTVRSIEVGRVVLSVFDNDPAAQRTTGQFVELTEAGCVRLRPWAVRWATPAELDEMAAAAGLVLEARWADMAGAPFDDHSSGHVSVYRRPPFGGSEGVVAAVDRDHVAGVV
jgi:SAM-dependent methyltransferase